MKRTFTLEQRNTKEAMQSPASQESLCIRVQYYKFLPISNLVQPAPRYFAASQQTSFKTCTNLSNRWLVLETLAKIPTKILISCMEPNITRNLKMAKSERTLNKSTTIFVTLKHVLKGGHKYSKNIIIPKIFTLIRLKRGKCWTRAHTFSVIEIKAWNSHEAFNNQGRFDNNPASILKLQFHKSKAVTLKTYTRNSALGGFEINPHVSLPLHSRMLKRKKLKLQMHIFTKKETGYPQSKHFQHYLSHIPH